MFKNLAEMQNISGIIHRMNTTTVIKVMLLFWIALLIQVKFNKKSRMTVIKTLYIMGGIVTVLGSAGTTGIVLYKHFHSPKGRKNQGELPKNEN